MALDRLAPDQRAVVQLVLAQERSYDELSSLLGISADAVRARAHAGLERLGPAGGVDDSVRASIADYLLGQQSVSERGETRRLLSDDPAAAAWARAVSGELEAVARSPLPEIPSDGAAAEPAPQVTPAPVSEPGIPAPIVSDEDDVGPANQPSADPAAPTRPVRVRPRPRPQAGPTGTPDAPAPVRAAKTAAGDPTGAPRRSRKGGALILIGLTIAVAALLVYLFVDRDDDSERASGGTPTATATATPDAAEPAFQLPLTAPGGGKAKGEMAIYILQDRQVAFAIQGENVPKPPRGEAYAMWLVGGKEPHRLGFITDENPDDGKIGSSGPLPADAAEFPQWFAEAKNVLVTRERTQDAKRPGKVVLRGTIPTGDGG